MGSTITLLSFKNRKKQIKVYPHLIRASGFLVFIMAGFGTKIVHKYFTKGLFNFDIKRHSSLNSTLIEGFV